jgi:hypothetical protein
LAVQCAKDLRSAQRIPSVSLLTGDSHANSRDRVNQIGIVGDRGPAWATWVQSGILGLEGAMTGLGNPASNLTVLAGAPVKFFNVTNQLNK